MQVNLQEPGAGLPFVERMIAKVGFRFLTRIKGREYFKQIFLDEADKIKELTEQISDEQKAQITLVDRGICMEDSSRNWSIYMTIQHLNMVNQGLSQLVEALNTDGVDISELQEVKVEDVKPALTADENDYLRFLKMNRILIKKLSGLKELRSERKHSHPWFGMLDGLQWFALMCVHMRIHRKQISRIVQKLK